MGKSSRKSCGAWSCGEKAIGFGNAQLMYKQKITNDSSAGYVKTALDYKVLETLCDEYEKGDDSSKDEKGES